MAAITTSVHSTVRKRATKGEAAMMVLLWIERFGSHRAPVPERDLFDARFCRLQQAFAMRLKRFAALVDGDRLSERRLAAFEPRHNGLELSQRRLERHRLHVVGGRLCHGHPINAV